MPEKIITVGVKKLVATATLPTKAFGTDAGFDLTACKKITINSSSEETVPTGIAIQIPTGYFGLIKIRSGFGIGLHLTESAGVIDSDYRGEIKVVLVNYSDRPAQIMPGDRIAQLLILPVPNIKIEEITELAETDRNDGGFGSTGR